MRISITDEFLYDVYNVLEKAGDIAVVLFKANPKSWGSIFENPVFKKYRHDKNKRAFTNLVYYLKRKGYIKVKNLESKQAILLTKEGINHALKTSFKLDQKKRADGKWVMLIFDIPEKIRRKRVLLRSFLLNLGYKMFQQSVWVSPYDVSEKTEKFLQLQSLDSYVRIFLIEEI